jgi:hypothetical protein
MSAYRKGHSRCKTTSRQAEAAVAALSSRRRDALLKEAAKLKVAERIARELGIQVGEGGFDRHFWRRVGPEARFAASWEIVKEYHLARGGRLDDLKLDRSVLRVVRLRRSKRPGG